MIELTYGDSADQDDLDTAILEVLDRKRGYVVQLTTARDVQDVVINSAYPDTLYYRRFDEPSGQPVGPTVAIDRVDIHAIKVY